MSSRGGQNGQTYSNFITGDPVGSNRTKIGGRLDMVKAAFWYFLSIGESVKKYPPQIKSPDIRIQ